MHKSRSGDIPSFLLQTNIRGIRREQSWLAKALARNALSAACKKMQCFDFVTFPVAAHALNISVLHREKLLHLSCKVQTRKFCQKDGPFLKLALHCQCVVRSLCRNTTFAGDIETMLDMCCMFKCNHA